MQQRAQLHSSSSTSASATPASTSKSRTPPPPNPWIGPELRAGTSAAPILSPSTPESLAYRSASLSDDDGERSVLVYETTMRRKILGAPILFLVIMIPLSLVVTYLMDRTVADEEADAQRKAALKRLATADDTDTDIILDDPSLASLSTPPSTILPRIQSSRIIQGCVVINFIVVAYGAHLFRFSRRTISTIRLYPLSRVLELSMVGGKGSVVRRRVDALLPPMVRHGQPEDLKCRMEFTAAPVVRMKDNGKEQSDSADDPLKLDGPTSFFLFPIPNAAIDNAPPHRRQAIQQVWHELVTTNYISQQQMESAARIAATKK